MTDCCCERHERVNGSPVCPLCVVHGSDPETRRDPSTLRAMAERWADRRVTVDLGIADGTAVLVSLDAALRAVATAMEKAGEP